MALDQNSKDRPDPITSHICIEPFLPRYLKPLPPGIPDVIEAPVQSVPMARLEAMEAGDILFLDSTHVVTRGSDTIMSFRKFCRAEIRRDHSCSRHIFP